MSLFLLIEGNSNVTENIWRHLICPRFSWSKVICISMKIPEDIIHVLDSPCRIEYLDSAYMSWFLLLNILSKVNVDENAADMTSILPCRRENQFLLLSLFFLIRYLVISPEGYSPHSYMSKVHISYFISRSTGWSEIQNIFQNNIINTSFP